MKVTIIVQLLQPRPPNKFSTNLTNKNHGGLQYNYLKSRYGMHFIGNRFVVIFDSLLANHCEPP